MDRHIEFEGTFNFRDIGGYSTEDGGTVRWRRVFRAGALDAMTIGDQMRAREDFGVSAIIDLRHPDEMEMYGPVRTALAGTSVASCVASLIPTSEAFAAHIARSNELHGLGQSTEKYGYLLEVGSTAIARAFEVFADDSAYAVIVHCTAGKDRTGIVIALLLEVLGVSRDQISADYELSNKSIPRLIEYVEAKGRTPDLSREEWEARLATPAERMTKLMDFVDREYGSARDYLKASGLDEASINRIVDLLVE